MARVVRPGGRVPEWRDAPKARLVSSNGGDPGGTSVCKSTGLGLPRHLAGPRPLRCANPPPPSPAQQVTPDIHGVVLRRLLLEVGHSPGINTVDVKPSILAARSTRTRVPDVFHVRFEFRPRSESPCVSRDQTFPEPQPAFRLRPTSTLPFGQSRPRQTNSRGPPRPRNARGRRPRTRCAASCSRPRPLQQPRRLGRVGTAARFSKWSLRTPRGASHFRTPRPRRTGRGWLGSTRRPSV